MIEVQAHSSLRDFLRQQAEPAWPHHLTMTRLVARALRLGRSALIQTGVSPSQAGRYRWSYLTPALLWPGPVVIITPQTAQSSLLEQEIPRLQAHLGSAKSVQVDDRFPGGNFSGLLLTTAKAWLADRLYQKGLFPDLIPTIFDGADDLESCTQTLLSATLDPHQWQALKAAFPRHQDAIDQAYQQLSHSIAQHPVNPYDCYVIDPTEAEILNQLLAKLPLADLPPAWQPFTQRSQAADPLLWTEVDRTQGQFSLICGPIDVSTALQPLWQRQPLVLIGAALDLSAKAELYRQRLGLGDLTCLQFSPDRQNEEIQLYIPDRLPFPNTPQFQGALLRQIHQLLAVLPPFSSPSQQPGLATILVEDTPLKAQVATAVAAEFGSLVRVERTDLGNPAILVTGWKFWRSHLDQLPSPQLLVIATLPIPSLEHPLIAGQVAYYKSQRKDWFRLYLLPMALNELQHAIAPVRESQGLVALLDSRVNHRSYGTQVLETLSPYTRLNYLPSPR